MAAGAKKPRKKVTRKAKKVAKPSFPKRVWCGLKKPLLIFSAVAVFVLACYIGYLDYTVRKQFEGKRWSIPARVYASPVELYAGLKMNAKQLLALLQKMHYRADRKLSSQATYDEKAGHISLKTRQFTFADKERLSQHIRIAFSGSEIRSIMDVQTGKELSIVRLDPVQIGSFTPHIKKIEC